jgi:phospholipid N-methyltransferase
MNQLGFLKNFLSNPQATGAIAASSPHLAELITSLADLASASVVVEFGPGTGVFTECILRKAARRTRFFAMEINPEFVRQTRQRCPAAVVHHDSAVHTLKYLQEIGETQCDRIISGLPWAGFPEALQNDLLGAIDTVLKPGGLFLTFAYVHGTCLPAGLRFRRKLQQHFTRVTRSRVVWRNLPPAFVYRAEK